ncbi:unnamed protein product [Bursaphelenchus okinawaensis]|uniref:SH3 domain-containing protein n=1 Tax=Bursaphelenchus okinawaensis TaxID=465554 RepID=A0A811LTI3_9BILA|nr:unnamed protein product [Bursaphelenchus okinawaensis]CAG9128648.1 unnamed protein product [Bursaphelenchus okinawaensis]
MFDSTERLPYIPPPDYSPLIKPVNSKNIYNKNSKPEKRVSIDAYDEFEPSTIPQSRDDHGQPHKYVPDIRPGRRYKVVHSYQPEPQFPPRDPQAVQQRVLQMLKEQGVPVLPFADQTIKEPIGPTKAYLKHLKNHQNFDTLKSFRSCDNCVLCKQIQGELVSIENKGRRPTSATRKPETSIINSKIYENPFYHEIANFEPIQVADQIHIRQPSNSSKLSVDVPVQARRTTFERTAKIRRDIRAQSHQQLNVFKGEFVKISQFDPNWSYCMNRHGQKGWVPTRDLNFATNSTSSSPMST